MLAKTLLTKKAHKKRLTSIEQSLMAGPNCWLGKRWHSPESGRAVAFIEGEGKEVSACAVVFGRGGAVLEHGNLLKGRAAILADSKNGDIIVLLLFITGKTHNSWNNWNSKNIIFCFSPVNFFRRNSLLSQKKSRNVMSKSSSGHCPGCYYLLLPLMSYDPGQAKQPFRLEARRRNSSANLVIFGLQSVLF
jgi:hypothetical protein